MERTKSAFWDPFIEDGEIIAYICSNCGEEEGPDAVNKFRRCPNCNYKMVNGHERVS